MAFRIERDLVVDADLAEVWAAIVGDGWLADDVRLDLRPGGDAHFRRGTTNKEGWVEEALAPWRLAFWWAADSEPASRVELTLSEEGTGRTRVRVVESQPLEILDLVGVPLARRGGSSFGPALVAA